MKSYDIYGTTLSIEQAKKDIEDKLSLIFKPRNSSYFGDYFSCGDKYNEGFEIKNNIDLIDNEPLDQKFANYPVLFFVNATTNSKKIQELLSASSLTLLSHNDYL